MKFARQLTSLLWPYRLQVALTAIALFSTTGAQLVIPRIIQDLIDVGLKSGDINNIIRAAFLILGIGAARAIIFFWQRYLSVWIAQHVAFDLRNRLYDHIQRLSFSFHDHTQSGQLISRCIEDVNSTNQFTGFGVIEMFQVAILLIGITVLLFLQNWQLAIVAILPILPMLLITTKFGKRIGELFYKVDQAVGELSTRVQENITGVQVIRAFAREPYEISRFDRANRNLYDTRLNLVSEFSKIFPTTQLLTALCTVLVLVFGGLEVIRGEMTIGEVVAFNAYLLLMATPAQQITWLVNMSGEASAGLNRIYEILDQKPEIHSPPDPIQLNRIAGKVEFRNVSVKYTEGDEYALKDINLVVKPEQVIALIGATGSGKTSLINLIPRFYDPTEGQVLIDNLDVRAVNLASLRRQIGIVLQTSLLFSDSVAENISYGKPDATDAEIIQAAQAAQAHQFIMELPEGYNTIVGERGMTLSGGQRQRIAIARALLLDPRILILDDSTSSVDTETEALIQTALGNLIQGRTTFIIAHRLSTVRKADLILVMDKGRIVQQGTHQELLQQEGIYHDIYELQLKKQELAAIPAEDYLLAQDPA